MYNAKDYKQILLRDYKNIYLNKYMYIYNVKIEARLV